jgi:hypothetical protein
MIIADAIYVICTVTSLVCTVLLARGYMRSRVPLLLWSSICFACFTLNNLLLFIDLDNYFFSNVTNLAPERTFPAAVGVVILCYALIAEAVR